MIRKYTMVLTPAGSAGSAAATFQKNLGRPGILRAISVAYTTQPSTTDVVVKADTSTGAALFTATDNNTDLVGKTLAQTGVNATNGAAATGAGVGAPFSKGLYVSVAQGDPVASGVIVSLWVEL